MAENIRQQFGNYRLIHLVGHGGFAEVYLSEHIYLRTQAAIKVLHMRLTEDILQDFLNEARTIAHLIHPGIVRILDFGVENTVPFLVMDYAPNGTLRQHHPRGSRLPLATIVSYIRQVAPALYYAHTQRLIHRDVKPENMLIDQNNNILLSDFGLVLIAQSTSSQTTKEMAGTVPYMAPEQLQGRPRPASDQYALGIIVYEWLSGERPFQGSFAEVASQHLLVPPPPLYDRIPGISPAVEQVVFTALAKDPQQRFASVQAFATAFEQASLAPQIDLRSIPWQVQSWQSTFVNTPLIELSQPKAMATPTNESAQSTPMKALPDQTIQSTFIPLPSSTPQATTMMPNSEVSSVPPTIIVPSDQPPSFGQKVSRRAIVVSLAGGLVLVGGGTTWLAHNLSHPKMQPVGINHQLGLTSIPESTPSTIPVNTLDPTAKPTTQPTAKPTTQPTTQPTAKPTADPIMHSTLVWRYQTEGPVGASPTLSGNTLYVGSFDGNMYAINASNGSVIWKYPTGNSITWSAATVANNTLYFGSKDTYVYALQANNGSFVWKYQTQGEVDNKPSVVNGVIYISSVDGSVYALDATTGSQKWSFPTGAAFGSSPVVANNVIYIGSQNGVFYALDATTGSQKWSFRSAGSGFAKLAIVSNGVVYLGAFDSNVYALNTSNGNLIWRFTTGGSVYSSPALANGTIYVGSDDGFLYALNANTGARLWRFPTIGASPSNIRSSPLVVNSAVYFGSWDRNFYAVNATNGTMNWNYPTGGYAESSPTYNNGNVYFGSDDGYIYALKIE